MPPNRKISGDECIKILVKHFGFSIKRQHGSHVTLRNNSQVTVVPRHKALAIGTLKGLLKLGKVDEEEFFRYT